MDNIYNIKKWQEKNKEKVKLYKDKWRTCRSCNSRKNNKILNIKEGIRC